jgi:hypothetical protein
MALFLFALKEGPHKFAKTTIEPRQIGTILRNKRMMLANAGYFGHMWELYALWGWFLAFVISVDPAGSFVLTPSTFAFLVSVLARQAVLLQG